MMTVVTGVAAAVEVEAEVPDVRAARRVDDHVVAVPGRVLREVGDLGEPVGIEPQQLPVVHRDDEHAPVGQPAQTRTGSSGTSTIVSTAPSTSIASTRRSCWSENHEPPVVPARPFRKPQPLDQHRRHPLRHDRT